LLKIGAAESQQASSRSCPHPSPAPIPSWSANVSNAVTYYISILGICMRAKRLTANRFSRGF